MQDNKFCVYFSLVICLIVRGRPGGGAKKKGELFFLFRTVAKASRKAIQNIFNSHSAS